MLSFLGHIHPARHVTQACSCLYEQCHNFWWMSGGMENPKAVFCLDGYGGMMQCLTCLALSSMESDHSLGLTQDHGHIIFQMTSPPSHPPLVSPPWSLSIVWVCQMMRHQWTFLRPVFLPYPHCDLPASQGE